MQIGHNMFLAHASTMDVTTGATDEYGDFSCSMGELSKGCRDRDVGFLVVA
jgi:hypothetical protein